MLVLTMDEIVNAICLHIAERKQIRPQDVQVELFWDEDTGYSAEVWAEGRIQYLVESNMIEASCVICTANTIFARTASRLRWIWMKRSPRMSMWKWNKRTDIYRFGMMKPGTSVPGFYFMRENAHVLV
ncbi:hypothetical protein CM49_01393 [Paenibacillus sp. P1XP2]|nr:hypothetical protein CM49_01393 [Paenibacillus sp. P1XP2]